MNELELMVKHGHALLVLGTRNSNGTAWFYGADSTINLGKDYKVLVDGFSSSYTDGITLDELYLQFDILEVSVDGVTVY